MDVTKGNSLVEMVKLQMPRTLGNGSNAYGMTIKMCDAYYMYDGSEFNRQTFWIPVRLEIVL